MEPFTGTLSNADNTISVIVEGDYELIRKPHRQGFSESLPDYRGEMTLRTDVFSRLRGGECRLFIEDGPSMMILFQEGVMSSTRGDLVDVPFIYAGKA